jgi:hypothetical protein
MGMQRISVDVYYSHEGAVDLGKEFVELAKSKGASPSAASVVNHPGADDEATTDLLAAPEPTPEPTPEPAAPEAP